MSSSKGNVKSVAFAAAATAAAGYCHDQGRAPTSRVGDRALLLPMTMMMMMTC